MIHPYSIHRTDRLITGFELCSAVIISLMLGWICAGSFGIAADVMTCEFVPGWVGAGQIFNGGE